MTTKSQTYKLNEIYLEGWYTIAKLEKLIADVKKHQDKLNKRTGKAHGV